MIEEINSLLRVERFETRKNNKGLKVYLKLDFINELKPFFLSEKEIDRMYEILHEKE